MRTYTLFDLQEHIRQVLALNFGDAVWITAEIAQASRSRGHLFLSLVQKGQDAESDVVAQAEAVLWQRAYQRQRMELGSVLDEVLQEGREVRVLVRVDYHERYGLKLLLEEVDPTYTFGRMELQRRQTIEALQRMGLLERNRTLALPPVLQRIAVISSEGAAGLRDFQVHLGQNAFGYTFHCRLFSASVQGQNLELEMMAALEAVAAQREQFDCVVILRGGGARLDLAGFDRLALCKVAAAMPLPLFTGIGHETDETVLDLVAHAALKTPTAVADFLIQHNLVFENRLVRLAERLHDEATRLHNEQALALERSASALGWAAQNGLRAARFRLDAMDAQLPAAVRHRLQKAAVALDQAEALCAAWHPEAALRRGFSLTRKNGKVVTSARDLSPGDQLKTQLREGTVDSIVSEPGRK